MIEFQYVIAPLVGGLIGYIISSIAIKMLFGPHKEKYVFGYKIPFTPGIISKEKGKIADDIEIFISENLMKKDVLEKYLLSDNMKNKVRTSVESFLSVQKVNKETVRVFLSHYLKDEEITSVSDSINKNLSEQIYKKLSDSNIGKSIAHIVVENISDKLSSNGVTELLSLA
jgi:uncharacterized membrane protein YheB (UPF0754 family)